MMRRMDSEDQGLLLPTGKEYIIIRAVGAPPQKYTAGGSLTLGGSRSGIAKPSGVKKMPVLKPKGAPCKACGGTIEPGNSLCFGCGAWNF